MKFLFLFFILFSIPQSQAITPTNVLEQVQRLASVSEGRLVTYDLRGGNPAELIMSFADQVTMVQQDTEFVFNYQYLETKDEMAYGSTDAKMFSNLIFSAIHFMDDDAETESEKVYSQQDLVVVRDALKQLESLPVIYSWDPNGNRVCGSSLTTPVIIDPAKKKGYALDFYFIGGC